MLLIIKLIIEGLFTELFYFESLSFLYGYLEYCRSRPINTTTTVLEHCLQYAQIVVVSQLYPLFWTSVFSSKVLIFFPLCSFVLHVLLVSDQR